MDQNDAPNAPAKIEAAKSAESLAESSDGSAERSSPPNEKKGFFGKKKKSAEKSKSDKEDSEVDRKGEKEAMEQKLNALDPHDAAIIRSQVEFRKHSANFFTLYRYAKPWDMVLVLLGIFFAIVHGVALPMFTLVVGQITSKMNSFVGNQTLDPTAFQNQVDFNARYFVYIGIGILGSSILESYLLVQTGETLAGRYRKNYLKAVVRQNIAYFDIIGSGFVSTRITNDTASVQEAISEKLGNILQGAATFVAAIVIAFTQQWKLSCILLSVVFTNLFVMSIGGRLMVKYETLSSNRYTSGSTIAEEAISSIRSTVAFGAQDRMVEKYDKVLRSALKPAQKSAIALASFLAGIWAVLFFTYALAYWEGTRIIAQTNGKVDIGKIICVIIAVLIGSFQLGNVAPNIRFIAKGVAACKSLNEAIDRDPIIDSEMKGGKTISDLKGQIELKNVRFRYPSRPDVLVLPDFSLTIPAGQTVALVGMSGSGKSTVVGILERFYLPLAGSVTLDGVEIDELDLKWLRQQIGFVQQEPTLFSDSIYENIAYGLIGTEFEHAPEEQKRSMVEEATREANAYDFIQTLTEGFDTNVGDRGFLLSGGQKQRIAIARAIVSNPRILLLDEATSALDTKSEGIVQDALDRASVNRTTIVIAHRLSTIKDAHKIVVMAKGEILEQGSHKELLSEDSYYRKLVEAQQVIVKKDGDSNEGQKDSSEPGLVVQEDKFAGQDIENNQEKSASTDGDAVDIPGIERPKDSTFIKQVALLWKLNAKEHWLIFLGAFCMILLGYCYPAMGQVTGHTIQSVMVPAPRYPQMLHDIGVLAGWFFFLGCIAFIVSLVGMTAVGFSSHRLVREVRLNLFRQILRLDISFFDHGTSSPGALTSILAKEARSIEGMGGATMGQIMQSFTTLIGGIATGIPYSWRVGLVALATVPVLLGCGFLRVKIMMSLEERGRAVYEGSGAMASQFTSAVRTVQSLTREDDVAERYASAIDKQIKSSRIPVARSAVLYGLSQGLTPWVIALIFWWGSTCLRKNQVGVLQYYVCFMCITLGSQAAGQIFSYAPDMGKAREAAANIHRILSAQPHIDVANEGGIVPDPSEVRGDIELKNVYFRYPTRPQVPVLAGLDLSVKKGQYIALVGASGCGKSTTIGLAERFYDVQKGAVLFDGKDVRDYNLQAMRSHIALVQQEPILFSGTLRENITMGWVGDENDLSDEIVYAAARKANIHDFIMSLPDGYNTTSGSRGSLLSGGQKQRIAIARALIRNPKVLLLDEATSALDSESEKVVQAALDEAAKGRTTIAVAHRLSTIQKADIIYVFDKGQIVERGNHMELLALDGRYAELVKLQSLEE